MRMSKILHAVKIVGIVVVAGMLYLLMGWGMTAILPMSSNGGTRSLVIVIGWIVLLSAWYGYLNICGSRWLIENHALLISLLRAFYVLLFAILFLFSGLMLLSGGYLLEQVSAGCGCMLSTVALFCCFRQVKRTLSGSGECKKGGNG